MIPQNPADLANTVLASPLQPVAQKVITRFVYLGPHSEWEGHTIYHSIQGPAYICKLIKYCTPFKLTMPTSGALHFLFRLPRTFFPQNHIRDLFFRPLLSHCLLTFPAWSPCPFLLHVILYCLQCLFEITSLLSLCPLFNVVHFKRVYFVKTCGVWSESITLRSKNGRLNLALPLTKEVTSGKELTSLTQWSPP